MDCDEVDVEFPTLEESTVEPPNPAYLKVHAAFAKVLHLSGVAEYIERVERDAEMEDTLRPGWGNGFRVVPSVQNSNFCKLLSRLRLAVVLHRGAENNHHSYVRPPHTSNLDLGTTDLPTHRPPYDAMNLA
jgi:hypothetical protein